jgi:hypothetical protein
MIVRKAQIDRKIRQSAAKSQESIMYYSNVWRIRIYQSSRSGLFSGLPCMHKKNEQTKNTNVSFLPGSILLPFHFYP